MFDLVFFQGLLTRCFPYVVALSVAAPAYLAGLPKTCKLSVLHAGSLCLWNEPLVEHPQGFGPFGLCQGWLYLGFCLGAFVAVFTLLLFGKLRQPPTADALARLAQGGNDRQREEVLAYLFARGRPALTELAAATGTTEAQFLTDLLQAAPPGFNLAVVQRRN